jgi:hypothetical protein
MSEETPDFSIDPDGGMTPPAQFTYKGHQVEIVPPDTKRLIGNYWQIKIDGVLERDLLFSSSRVAADRAQELIDQERDAGLLAIRQAEPKKRKIGPDGIVSQARGILVSPS